MNNWVAFLRAINVAGHARVKMTDLKAAFTAADCKNVRTYIQSGNVLFETSHKDITSLIRKIKVNLRDLIGSEVTVMFRTIQDLEATVKVAPFKALETDPDVKLYVAFLSQKPRTDPKLPLVSAKEALETVKIGNMEVFVVSRKKKNGMYGFPNSFVEKEFGVSATTRNWTTINRIVNLSRES